MSRAAPLVVAVVLAGCGRSGFLTGEPSPSPTGPTPTPTQTATPPPGSYGIPLVIPGAKIHDDLVSFPVWVDVTRPELRDVANGGHVLEANGDDLLFRNGASEILPVEILSYDPAAGRLRAWVALDAAALGVDASVSVVYGDAAFIGLRPAPEQVWSGFSAVWHLEDVGDDDSGTVPDSTANAHGGRDDSGASAIPGKAGTAAAFGQDSDNVGVNGGGASIAQGGLNGSTASFTVQAWFRRDMATGGWDTIIEKGIFSSQSGWGFYVERQGTPETLALYLADAQGNQSRNERAYTPTDGAWHFVAATVNRVTESVTFFADGASLGSDDVAMSVTGDSVDTNATATIGQNTGLDSCCAMRGAIDELMVSSDVRSTGWLQTAWENQSDPATFAVPGTEVAF